MESNANIIKYWNTQPEVLDAMLADSRRLTEEFVRLYQEVRPTHLYLAGSGTSLNAEEAAAAFMEEVLGVKVSTMPSSYIHNICGERPLIIFVSQGGSSTNTLKAMEQVKEYPFITVTGEEKCEIASRSSHHMIIGCGEEPVGPKTVGYTASVMVLYLMAVEAGKAAGSITDKKYEEIRETLSKGIYFMRKNMAAAMQWIEKQKEELKEIKKYIFIGHGTGAAALREGCLKVLETVKYPAFSYEFEEYLHGPILAADDKTGAFLFLSGNGEERERFEQLALCQKKYSKYTYVITDEHAEETDAGVRKLSIDKTGKMYTEVFEIVVIPQLMAALIQGYLGIADGSALYDEYTSICPTKYNNGK